MLRSLVFILFVSPIAVGIPKTAEATKTPLLNLEQGFLNQFIKA